MTHQEIDNLFAATLRGHHDDDGPWEAVSELRGNANEYIFEKAKAWCDHPDPKHRARGAAILCQLRAPHTPEQGTVTSSEPIFVDESFRTIIKMIATETDEQALSSELFGLGHLYNPEAVPILIKYGGHVNEEIRFAVACSLGHFPEHPTAINHLMNLADDPDGDIRNWSLFALGTQSDFDSPELRDLFVRHLHDPDEDAQQEGIAGLAKRKDPRAALPLLRLMQSGAYFSHHEYDFKCLLEAPDDAAWGNEDFIVAIYERFPELLPPREEKPGA